MTQRISYLQDVHKEDPRFMIDWSNNFHLDTAKEVVRMFKENTVDSIKKKTNYQGIPIHIEWPKGSTRTWKGSSYRRSMLAHYGFIPNVSSSDDGDEIDVYLGDQPSDKVYVMKQLDMKSGDHDEYKYMLGFPDEQSAKNMFALHVDQLMNGGLEMVYPFDNFKAMISNLTEQRNLLKVVMKLEKLVKGGLYGN